MRKIIIYMLSLVMVFAPAIAANAATSMGGWTALDTITAGATNTINAVKGAGATGMRSAVSVAPSAVKVGKHLIKGGGAAALAFAMVELLDAGIDWVLDPANNRIKYTEAVAGEGDGGSVPVGGLVAYYGDTSYASPSSLCAAAAASAPSGYQGNASVGTVRANIPAEQAALGYQVWDCGNPVYNGHWATPKRPPAAGSTPSEGKEKYISIESVAAKVIANAEAGHAPSQEAVKATALEGFEAGDYDTALESAAIPDSTVDTDTPPVDTPADPTKPFDPAGILSAIAALKAVLAGLVAAVVGLSDFFQSDPPPEKPQKETDVPIDSLPPTKNASEFDVKYVSFGGQCPVLPSFNVGVGSVSTTMSFDVTPLCDLAVMIRPAIIAISYFIGLGVIASAIRET